MLLLINAVEVRADRVHRLSHDRLTDHSCQAYLAIEQDALRLGFRVSPHLHSKYGVRASIIKWDCENYIEQSQMRDD
jgi:hypothetical protein